MVATTIGHASYSELWAMDYRAFWRSVVKAHKINERNAAKNAK